MRSNIKTINFEGNKVDYEACPIICGESDTNYQHSFYQLIHHQGTKFIPCDFIGFINPLEKIGDHREEIMANYFAQLEVLAFGLTKDEVIENLKKADVFSSNAKLLTSHKMFDGNKPTNSILIDKLTPRTLGALIALYEHKIFTQGIICQINNFDQWGIEFSKVLANVILTDIKGETDNKHDSSTNSLIKIFKSNKK